MATWVTSEPAPTPTPKAIGRAHTQMRLFDVPVTAAPRSLSDRPAARTDLTLIRRHHHGWQQSMKNALLAQICQQTLSVELGD
jgi:hypothetical protein